MSALRDFDYLNFIRKFYGFFFKDNYKLNITIFTYVLLVIFSFINMIQDSIQLYKENVNYFISPSKKKKIPEQ